MVPSLYFLLNLIASLYLKTTIISCVTTAQIPTYSPYTRACPLFSSVSPQQPERPYPGTETIFLLPCLNVTHGVLLPRDKIQTRYHGLPGPVRSGSCPPLLLHFLPPSSLSSMRHSTSHPCSPCCSLCQVTGLHPACG